MIVQELVAKLGLEVDTQVFSRVQQALTMTTGALALVGGAFGAVMVGYAGLVHSTASAADEVLKLSEQTGIASDALQSLQFAAERSDSSAETLTSGLRVLARTAYAASKGGEEAGAAYAKLGVRLRDGEGKLRSADTLLLDIADKFKAMGEGKAIEKAALASKLFGRSAGPELLGLLNRGSEGIAELQRRAHELGVVMDPETLLRGAEFDDAVKELNAAFTGLRNAIGGPLIKSFTTLITMTTNLIAKNRQLIAIPLVKFFDGVSGAAKTLAENMWAVRWIIGTVFTLMAFKGIAALTALTSAQIAWGAAALIAGARAAFAAVAPIAAWVALAALIFLIGEDIYQFFTGGESALGRYGQSWTNFLDNITERRPTDNWLVGWLRASGRALFDFGGVWTENIANWKILWTHYMRYIEVLSRVISKKIQDAIMGAINAVKDAIPNFGILDGLNNAGQSANKFLTGVLQPFQGGAANPTASVQNSASTISNKNASSVADNRNMTVNVNATSSDPAAIADQTATKMREILDTELRASYAGVTE